jgi:DNA polymerase IV (DinB-like DNA polymerase)
VNNTQRIIFHIDLDAFFASCEERENPQFAGMPIVVGADPKDGKGRGVVSTANYTARKFGIHSALPISQAWRLCPSAIFLPVNGTLYSRVSRAVMQILQDTAQKHNGKFEQVGIDEAYLDLSNRKITGSPNHSLDFARDGTGQADPCGLIARQIKQKIYAQEKVTASVGVGPNMLIAKIASDFQKPDGLTIVREKDVQKFLDPLPIRKLPGIGPKTESELQKFRVETVSDLRKISQSVLYDEFGQHGISIYESARGIDHRVIGEESEAKSISEDHTFEHDTDSAQEILPVFFALIKNVLKTAESDGYKNFKTITVKIRYADFKTHTKSQSDKYAAKNSDKIEKLALQLLWPFLKNRKIRLIGFRVSGFRIDLAA